MAVIKEQAVQTISAIYDDNAMFLVERMTKFILLKEVEPMAGNAGFTQEVEIMRVKSKPCFRFGVDIGNIWKEAMDEKYRSL